MKLITRVLTTQKKLQIATSLFFMHAAIAMAISDDAPWIGVLGKLVNYLTGPTMRLISIIAVIYVGWKFIFGNAHEGGTTGLKVAFGVSIALAAASWGPKFFGYSGAVLM